MCSYCTKRKLECFSKIGARACARCSVAKEKCDFPGKRGLVKVKGESALHVGFEQGFDRRKQSRRGRSRALVVSRRGSALSAASSTWRTAPTSPVFLMRGGVRRPRRPVLTLRSVARVRLCLSQSVLGPFLGWSYLPGVRLRPSIRCATCSSWRSRWRRLLLL
jgi:hypothetical protein